MMSTRRTLATVGSNLDESMGVREDHPKLTVSPTPQQKDIGRKPSRDFGRLDVAQLTADPDQPRVEFDEDAIDRLANSIREKGQLSPIRVRWSGAISKWIIVAGERRWRAAQRAGLPTIDCYFHDGPLSESHILEEQLIENCLREDLQPIEEAQAFQKLMTLNGWNAKQLAESVRLHPSKVSRTLALLRLPADIRQQVATGQIAARSAYEISKLVDASAQHRLAAKVRSENLTQKQAAGSVRQRRGKRKRARESRNTRQTFLTENGWTVIVSSNNRGTYHDLEEALTQALEEVRHRIDNNIQLY